MSAFFGQHETIVFEIQYSCELTFSVNRTNLSRRDNYDFNAFSRFTKCASMNTQKQSSSQSHLHE